MNVILNQDLDTLESDDAPASRVDKVPGDSGRPVFVNVPTHHELTRYEILILARYWASGAL